MADELDRIAALSRPLSEHHDAIVAALDGAQLSAHDADNDALARILEAAAVELVPILERMHARLLDALGPDWDRDPVAPGATRSADRRSYAHRDEGRRS